MTPADISEGNIVDMSTGPKHQQVKRTELPKPYGRRNKSTRPLQHRKPHGRRIERTQPIEPRTLHRRIYCTQPSESYGHTMTPAGIREGNIVDKSTGPKHLRVERVELP